MENQKFGITEGLLIAGIPVVGYGLAFFYELGYCKYFNIPILFIEIDLQSILIAIVGILSLVTIIYFIIDMTGLSIIYSMLPNWGKGLILPLFIMIGLIWGFGTIEQYSFQKKVINSLLIISIMFFLMLISRVILPLILKRKNKQDAAQIISKGEPLMGVLMEKIGRKKFLFGLTILAVFLLTYLAGGINAKIQEKFIVLPSVPESVILKKYNTLLLVAHFDRPSKSVFTEFKLVPADKDLGYFKFEQVGPLKPKHL